MNFKNLEIIFEDNHLLVINKPCGILSHGDKTKDKTMANYAEDYIRYTYNKPGNVFVGITHRIDRPVSGTFIVAKTGKALSRINESFRNNKVVKTYFAISKSRPEELSGKIVSYLKKDHSRNKTKIVQGPKGDSKKSELQYELVSSLHGNNLIKVNPITGRSHQIRVQLNQIGCTILGDSKYGHHTKWLEDKSIALHCYSIELNHPTKKEPIKFCSAFPDSPHWNIFKELDLDSL